MHLRVLPPDGKVKISAPYRMDIETIRQFALLKLSWIEKHQEKFLREKQELHRKYISGEVHYFRGKKYQLQVCNHVGPSKVVIRNQEYIDLYVPKGSDLETRKRILIEWYRQQLKARVPSLVQKWEKIIGVVAQEWRIKQMKTRWGSCSIKLRRIWLNLELAKKPEYCLEYVIVHELIHLLEPSHDSRFKSYMDQFMPQWRKYKKELV